MTAKARPPASEPAKPMVATSMRTPTMQMMTVWIMPNTSQISRQMRFSALNSNSHNMAPKRYSIIHEIWEGRKPQQDFYWA